jgi:hypothetical protein
MMPPPLNEATSQGLDMIRIIANLFAVTIVFAVFLHIAPVSAAPFETFVSSTGSDANPCNASLPCATIGGALNPVNSGGHVICLSPPGMAEGLIAFSKSATIDCPGALTQSAGFIGFVMQGNNQVLTIRNLTINGTGTSANAAIKVTGDGTLIIENCVFENFAGVAALDIEASGALNLVVTNSRISNSGAGVLIKPTGSVTATFNGVTIVDNTGGGLKADATNGPIAVDISNSTISNNGGNGINAVGGTIYANLLNLSHNVIAKNGSAGVQANGAEAAALIDTTLLDTNTAGATSAVGGGRLLTYGNNHIVGSAGSGFTGTAPSQ